MTYRRPHRFELALIFGTWWAIATGLPPAAHAATPPAGGYSTSCRDVAVVGTSLRASCKNFNGDWADVSTLPNFAACSGDIFNYDGTLRCAGNARPVGTYVQSCRDYNFDNNKMLYARCQNFTGAYVLSSLATSGCSSNISNIDGHLRCDVTKPSGSYLRTCWDIRVTANTINATCSRKDGSPKAGGLNLANADTGCSSGQDLSNVDGLLTCSNYPVPSTSGGTCAPLDPRCTPAAPQPGVPPGQPSQPNQPGVPPGQPPSPMWRSTKHVSAKRTGVQDALQGQVGAARSSTEMSDKPRADVKPAN